VLHIYGNPEESGSFIYTIQTYGKCPAPEIQGEIIVTNNMIFPNPTNDNVNIVKKGKFKIKVFNSYGMLLFYSDTLEMEDSFTLNLKGIVNSTGVYFIELYDLNNKRSSVHKIIFTN
jgi:hypothetical protein